MIKKWMLIITISYLSGCAYTEGLKYQGEVDSSKFTTQRPSSQPQASARADTTAAKTLTPLRSLGQ